MARHSEFVLSRKQVRELQDALADAERRNDLKMHRRARALLLVGRDHRTRLEAAQICGVDECNLYRWQARYRAGGVDALHTQKAPGAPCRLTEDELARLEDLVEAGPEASGFDTGVWTAPQIQKLLKRDFGQSYSASQISRLLTKLGFSFQLPKIRLARADEEAKQDWRERRFPELQARAAEEGGVIFLRMSRSSSSPEPRQERGRGWARASKSKASR